MATGENIISGALIVEAIMAYVTHLPRPSMWRGDRRRQLLSRDMRAMAFVEKFLNFRRAAFVIIERWAGKAGGRVKNVSWRV